VAAGVSIDGDLNRTLGGKKAAQCIIRAAARDRAFAALDTVSQRFAPAVLPESTVVLPSLRIGYSPKSADAVLNERDVLAVIAFDARSPCTDVPGEVRIGLEAIGTPRVEVWRGSGDVRRGRDGDVRWSIDDAYGCFAIDVEETADGDIEATAEHAYRALVASIRASTTPHVLRLWNYFGAINVGGGDEERYRRFCVGRARGMAGEWLDAYPAATAIGRNDRSRTLQVYALTARAPGVAVENPRQVNAWRYPREYGPIPPSFARGMRTPARQLLISGTAAVVGSASCHAHDVGAQLEESLTNIATLIATAGGGSVLKAYVRERDDVERVATRLREILGGDDNLVVLHGDICRRELLVEVDGIHG
jgi:chorismate lyase/3-hydroxybenzoate synthase